MAAAPVTRFCDPQEDQAVKGAIHGAVLTLSLMCCVYNACAWHQRRVARLAVNAGLYAALSAFEVTQIWRHLR